MALEFDPTQVPAILATLFSAGTLGGVIKLTRWTANHDSRAAQIEKDHAKHCADDKEVHEGVRDKLDNMLGKFSRRDVKFAALEANVQHLQVQSSLVPQNFQPIVRHRTNDASDTSQHRPIKRPKDI